MLGFGTIPNPKELNQAGYCKFPAFYPDDVLQLIGEQAELLVTRLYTQELPDLHSVYPSDQGDACISHAVMLSEGESDLPAVSHTDLPEVDRFLGDYHQVLAEITGYPVAPHERTLLNYQNYFSGSKPVGELFDGEYLKTRRAVDGIEFSLEDGILPRYVAILVISNDNQGKGIELVDTEAREVHRPSLNAGDLMLFDNIRLRHRVPSLEHPRTTIGVRNFDHRPLHFARTKDYFLSGDYYEIAEGWVSEDADCGSRLRRFTTDEWPQLKQEYSHYF